MCIRDRYGTSGTCAWLNKHMVPCNEVRNISGEAPNIVDLLQSGCLLYTSIDEAEDRERFDELLERCNIPRAPGRTVFNLDEALAAAEAIGLPVLMRPSYAVSYTHL